MMKAFCKIDDPQTETTRNNHQENCLVLAPDIFDRENNANAKVSWQGKKLTACATVPHQMQPSEETGTHLYTLRGPEDSISRTSILYHRTAELQIKLNTHFALNAHSKTSKQVFKSHTEDGQHLSKASCCIDVFTWSTAYLAWVVQHTI